MSLSWTLHSYLLKNGIPVPIGFDAWSQEFVIFIGLYLLMDTLSNLLYQQREKVLLYTKW